MLAAEGQTHKRQRRVATPAFSVQNLKALVPLVFRKGIELKDKWTDLIDMQTSRMGVARIDVCHWTSRATFDVIGIAGLQGRFYFIPLLDHYSSRIRLQLLCNASGHQRIIFRI
jgi:cytochrome P450